MNPRPIHHLRRTSHVASVQVFGGGRCAAEEARRYAGRILTGVSEQALDDVLLCVSELATNAVVHGPPDAVFILKIWADTQRVRVECHDRGGGWPHLRHPPDGEPNGRGLLLVNELTSRWGVARRRFGIKFVWFEMDLETRDPRLLDSRRIGSRT